MNADDEANLAGQPRSNEAKYVALLEQYRQTELTRRQSLQKQKAQRRAVFIYSSLLTMFWLIIWAIGVSGAVKSWLPFMQVSGSLLLAAFMAFFLFALSRLMRQPKVAPASHLPEEWENYINHYLAKQESSSRQYARGIKDPTLAAIQKSRLLKLQEFIAFTGTATIEWQTGNKSLMVSDLQLCKKIAQQPARQQINGIVVQIRLPQEIRNNAIFFSLNNEQQHFESLSFNSFILGDNEVRRLVKEHDHRIAHDLVDEFNKHFLLVGRNPAWLVEHIDENSVATLLRLDKEMQHNIRIEIDGNYLRAFLPYAGFLAMPSLQTSWNADLLREHLQSTFEKIDALTQDLSNIIHDIYGF